VELTILGTHGMYAGPGGATAGYLLRHDGFSLWIDLGSGTLANLQRHVAPLDVGAVIVSHRHPDHFVDLFPYLYARVYGSDEKVNGTPLFGPPELFDKVAHLLSGAGADEMGTSFALNEVRPGQGFEAGPFRVRTALMAHPVPTIGLRVEAGGKVFAYTADTGPTEAITGLAQGVDLLLSEATWQEDGTPFPPDVHLTAKQAGEHAARANARRLMLTHIKPTLDRERTREETATAFDGEILLATEGMVLEVGT
jgi:ribonuclease BN (tRNA processing enzyme)